MQTGFSVQLEKHWEEATSCLCREISPCLMESWLRDQAGTMLGKGLTPDMHTWLQVRAAEMHTGPSHSGLSA